MNKISFHKQIHESLLKEISTKSPGAMLPTEKDLAAQFKVSRTTIQNVMRELASNGLLERVKGRGTFIAQNIKEIITEIGSNKSGVIAHISPDYPAVDYVLFSHLIQNQATMRKKTVSYYKTKENSSHKEYCRWLDGIENLEGAIIIFPGNEISVEILKALDKLKVPIVVLGDIANTYIQLLDNVCVITPNNTKSGYLTFSYLFEKNHTRIGFIACEPWNSGSDIYMDGAKLAYKERGIPNNQLILPKERVKTWDDSIEKGYQMTKKMITAGAATALVYPSFYGAIGGLRALYEEGKTVPKDYSLIVNGSSDRTEAYQCPRLTTVTCTREDFIAEAFALLFSGDAHRNRETLVDVTLNEQESVKPLK